MAGYVQVPPDSTGKKIDTVTLTDAASEVHRQKMVVTGGSGTAEVVVVTNAAPGATDMGLVVRQAGTADVALAGKVTLSGTATVVGNISITGTAVVSGLVGLTAGTAVIGDLNAISRTVQVAVGTPFTLQGISTTVNVAIATPYILQGISTTVTVAGNVNLSATATVAGSLNISGSVVVAGNVNLFTSAAVPSASRGPRCVIASTSGNVTLIAAPGVGISTFITHIAVSNASGANTRARIGTSASIGQVTMMMAQSAGGFVMTFTPPWEVSANEAVLCSVKPNASEGIFNVHYFAGSADAF